MLNVAVDRCGFNNSGQLGHGNISKSTTPVPVSEITAATAVSAGLDFACAVFSGGIDPARDRPTRQRWHDDGSRREKNDVGGWAGLEDLDDG